MLCASVLLGPGSVYRTITVSAEENLAGGGKTVITATQDTHVQGMSSQDNIYWNSPELQARDRDGGSNPGQYIVPYVEFRLPSKNEFSDVDSITSAKIRMYISSNANTSSVNYFVGYSKLNETEAGIEAFSPENTEKPITYRNMFSYELGLNPADCNRKWIDLAPIKIENSTTEIPAQSNQWIEFDITAKVKELIAANSAPRETIFAICYESKGAKEKVLSFRSQEYGDDGSYAPQLVINTPGESDEKTDQVLLQEDFSRFNGITDGATPVSGAKAQDGQSAGEWKTYNESGLSVVTEENGNQCLKFATNSKTKTGYKFEFTNLVVPRADRQLVVESKIKVNAPTSNFYQTANISLGIPGTDNTVNNRARIAVAPTTSSKMLLIPNEMGAPKGFSFFTAFSNAADYGPEADEWYWVRFYPNFNDGTFQVWGSRDGEEYTRMMTSDSAFPFIGGMSNVDNRKGLREVLFEIYYNGSSATQVPDVTAYLDDVKVYLTALPYAINSAKFIKDGNECTNVNFVDADTKTIQLMSDAAGEVMALAEGVTLKNMTDNEPVTLNANSFALEDKTILIDIDGKLAGDKSYELRVPKTVLSADGKSMVNDYVLNFKTKKESYPSYEELYYEDFNDAVISDDEETGISTLTVTDERGTWEINRDVSVEGSTIISDDYGTKSLKMSSSTTEAANYKAIMTLKTPVQATDYKQITVESRIRRNNIANQDMQLPRIYRGTSDGGNDIVSDVVAQASNGHFSAGSSISNVKFDTDKWYTVKLVMNFETNTNDLIINGITVVKDGAFINNLTSVQKLDYKIMGAGDLYIDYIRIVGGDAQEDIIFGEDNLGYVTGIGKNIKVTATPENATGAANLFVAVYDKGGKLYKTAAAHTEDVAVSGVSATIDMTDVADPGTCTVRAFVWNDELQPLNVRSSGILNGSPELNR